MFEGVTEPNWAGVLPHLSWKRLHHCGASHGTALPAVPVPRSPLAEQVAALADQRVPDFVNDKYNTEHETPRMFRIPHAVRTEIDVERIRLSNARQMSDVSIPRCQLHVYFAMMSYAPKSLNMRYNVEHMNLKIAMPDTKTTPVTISLELSTEVFTALTEDD